MKRVLTEIDLGWVRSIFPAFLNWVELMKVPQGNYANLKRRWLFNYLNGGYLNGYDFDMNEVWTTQKPSR